MRTKPGACVTIKDDRTGYQYPESMFKCGKDEMYLESNYAQRPGSALHILVSNREPGVGHWDFPAVITWRKLLCGFRSSWSFGLGIKNV